MNRAELETVLDNHREWLADGRGKMADLRGADLRGADLRGANLSGAKGLLSAAEWLTKTFESDSDGLIVYKAFGYFADPPDHWEIELGSVLTETPNPDRCATCGSGINFAPIAWIKGHISRDIWRCRLAWIDLADVVVPFNTDGKARCARLTLIEQLKGADDEQGGTANSAG